MPVRPLLLAACLQAAAPAGARAQEASPTAALLERVPADAVLVAEIPQPAALWQQFRAGEPWRRFQAGPVLAQVQQRPEYLMAMTGLGLVANAAGCAPEDLLPAVAGGGAVFAVLPADPPATLLLLRALDPEVAQDALQALASLGAQGPSIPDEDHWRVTTPKGVLERRGDLFLLASAESALERMAASAAQSVAQVPAFRDGRAAAGAADAWLWLNGAALRSKPIPERPEDTGGSFLTAPLNEVLRHADWGTLALRLQPDGLLLQAALPAPQDLAESHAPYFPAAHPITLPRLEQELGVLVFARDWGAWWTGRDRYMSARALADTVDDDTNASTLFGRDYGTEVLHWLEPEMRLVFARNPDPGRVPVEYPAGALGLRLRADAPADLAGAFPSAWMAIITILNFQGGSMSEDSLLQDLDSLPDGTKLYWAHYRRPDDGPEPVQHQFTPALALRPDGEIWLSSSTPFLRALLAAPVDTLTLDGDFARVRLAPGRPIVQADRAALVAQQTVKNGGDAAAAQAWFSALAAGLELVDDARLSQELKNGQLRYQLELHAHAPH